jgi:hypothetical protein
MNYALEIACPKCGVPEGVACHSVVRGHEPYPIKSHKERVAAAWRARHPEEGAR